VIQRIRYKLCFKLGIYQKITRLFALHKNFRPKIKRKRGKSISFKFAWHMEIGSESKNDERIGS
jgi:hypothetical protein